MKESKVKANNYVTIQGWMVTNLGLKGTEIIVYAIIYGFSQISNQNFTGSMQYLADWCNCSRNGIQKTINSLIKKGLIVKKNIIIDKVMRCEYCTTELSGGVQLSCQGCTTELSGGVQLSCHNNINNNININNTLSEQSSDEEDIKKFDENSNEMKLVDFMIKQLSKVSKTIKLPDERQKQKWAAEFDKMMRIDKRSPHEICAVIKFAASDPFWQCNILSPKSLRKQYDRLFLKMGQPSISEKKASGMVVKTVDDTYKMLEEMRAERERLRQNE